MVTSAAGRATDLLYMERALFHAARGRGRTSPNPMVGAVVVSADRVVVGQGHHERAGGPHAEVHALAAAGPRARGATLYCTLEPCSHQGRTGPCVTRIVDAGIARVVAAVEDPNPLVRGQGFAFLRARGVDVEVGPGAAGAVALNQPFFTLMRERRPFVILKAAVSLDGCIAEAPGRRTQLTSEASSRHTHGLRAEVDAIAVGVGTILIDDPLLTARGPYRERPLMRVIFDRRLRTPPAARVLSTRDAGPVIIITTAAPAERNETSQALEAAGAQILVARDRTLGSALKLLGDRDVSSLLIEGGAAVHQAALEEQLADYVRLYVTPKALGARGVSWLGDSSRTFSTGTLIDRRIETIGPDVLIEGYVHRPR
jgi:diaminohydroxyphosphoribosylaminopyrimidine deaminase/5-amino-6-(5-phosphoribosylamino)uracil reductase